MIKLVKYVIASNGWPQSPLAILCKFGLQSGGWIINDSNTSFQPADVIKRKSNCMLRPNVWKFTISLRAPCKRTWPNNDIPNMAYMNVINAKSAPILKSAGSDTTKANSNFRMPLAALINRSILPIRKTRTTRSNVGDIGKSIITSSMRIPKIEAKTSKKSNTFHGTVK